MKNVFQQTDFTLIHRRKGTEMFKTNYFPKDNCSCLSFTQYVWTFRHMFIVSDTTTYCDILSLAGGSPLQPDTFHLWYSSSLLFDRFLISLGICLLLLQVSLVSIGSLGVFWCPTKVTSIFAFLAGRDSLLWPGNNPLTPCWPAVLPSSVSFSGVVLLPFENLWMLLGSVVGLHNSSPEKWGTFN